MPSSASRQRHAQGALCLFAWLLRMQGLVLESCVTEWQLRTVTARRRSQLAAAKQHEGAARRYALRHAEEEAAAAMRDRQLRLEREAEELPTMGSVDFFGSPSRWGASPEREGLRATPRGGHPRYELAGVEPGALRRQLPGVSRAFAEELGLEPNSVGGVGDARVLQERERSPPLREEPARAAEGCLIDVFSCEAREPRERGCNVLGFGGYEGDGDPRAASGCHVDNTGPDICAVQ